MKTKSIILIATLLLGNYSAFVIAQDGLSLMEKLERVTKEREPQWTLDRKLPVEKLFVLRWSSNEGKVFMSITVAHSPDEAKEIYESSVARLNEQLGTKGTKSTLPNLGAENQVWTGYYNDGTAALEFWQGKVHVILFAPSEDVAKRFARYVSDLVPSPKSPQAEDIPQTWKQYSSAEGGFSILFPGAPSQETQVIEPAPGVKFELRILKVNTLAECSVMYADYPMPVEDPAVAKSVLDNGAKGAVASVKSELLEFKEIMFEGHPGRYLKERMPSGEIMRVKMFLVGQRLYQVAITTPREEGKSAEIVAAYQAMSEKFLNSFKLNKKREQSASGN